jgi:hypothetical protein
VVESDGLENRCTRKGTVGSNPTLSAISILDFGFWIEEQSGFWTDRNPLSCLKKSTNGKMQEWLNWQHWKCCVPQKGTVGSNPTLSAISISDLGFGNADLNKIPNPHSQIPNHNMASGSAQGLSRELR